MAEDKALDTWAHLPFLRSVAKGSVLEIGVHCGISTTAFLAGLEDNGGHLWSKDTHTSCRYVWYGHPQWTFICPSVGEELRTDTGPLDVLFVDGDHENRAVLFDLDLYGHRVKPGGLILCHDAAAPSFPGVRQAIDEYCAAHNLKHELRTGSFGLEVIYAYA